VSPFRDLPYVVVLIGLALLVAEGLKWVFG